MTKSLENQLSELVMAMQEQNRLMCLLIAHNQELIESTDQRDDDTTESQGRYLDGSPVRE